jgi:hypothetical protein
MSVTPTPLTRLLEAKEHSDRRRMTQKRRVMRQLLLDHPEEFEIDDPQGPHVGLTHIPTGFRIHVPREITTAIPTKQAFDERWEKGPQVLFPALQPAQHATTYGEEILGAEPGRRPNPTEIKRLTQWMAQERPEHLRGVRVHVGRMDPRVMLNEIHRNPRTSLLGKTWGYATHWPLYFQRDGDLRDAGPFYHPLTDNVYVPWEAPAAAMHELGHAIDFNRGGIPENPVLREAKGLTRDLYSLAPLTTLWKEHQAWNEGRAALETGALRRRMPWAKVRPALENDAHARAPALGSYWGSAAGLAGSIGTILALRGKGLPALAVGGLAGIPLVAGPLTGMLAGKYIRDRRKKQEVEGARRAYEELLRRATARA